MPDPEPQTCIAFEGQRRIASGPLALEGDAGLGFGVGHGI